MAFFPSYDALQEYLPDWMKKKLQSQPTAVPQAPAASEELPTDYPGPTVNRDISLPEDSFRMPSTLAGEMDWREYDRQVAGLKRDVASYAPGPAPTTVPEAKDVQAIQNESDALQADLSKPADYPASPYQQLKQVAFYSPLVPAAERAAKWLVSPESQPTQEQLESSPWMIKAGIRPSAAERAQGHKIAGTAVGQGLVFEAGQVNPVNAALIGTSALARTALAPAARVVAGVADPLFAATGAEMVGEAADPSNGMTPSQRLLSLGQGAVAAGAGGYGTARLFRRAPISTKPPIGWTPKSHEVIVSRPPEVAATAPRQEPFVRETAPPTTAPRPAPFVRETSTAVAPGIEQLPLREAEQYPALPKPENWTELERILNESNAEVKRLGGFGENTIAGAIPLPPATPGQRMARAEPGTLYDQFMAKFEQGDLEGALALGTESEANLAAEEAGRPVVAPTRTAAPATRPAPPAAPVAVPARPTAVTTPEARPAPPATTGTVATGLAGTTGRRSPVIELSPEQTASIQVSPKDYQFKASDAAGLTGALRGVNEWDPASPPVTLHQRLDGTVHVADGHQRLAKYRELQAAGQQLPPLQARVYREADGYTVGDARRVAAMQNIQSLTASPVDIAKLLREGPLTPGERARISKHELSGAAARQGEGLSQLDQGAFDAVVNGEAPADQAFLVARHFTDPKEQLAVVKALGEAGPRNQVQAEAFIRSLKQNGFSRAVQSDLFGEQTQAISLSKPVAEIADATERLLRGRRAAFASVLQNAPKLEEAGNVLAGEANTAAAGEARQLIAYFRKYQDAAGSATNAALRTAAREVYEGRLTTDAAANHILDAVRRDIETGGAGRGAVGVQPAIEPTGQGQPAGPGSPGQLGGGQRGVPPQERTAPEPVAPPAAPVQTMEQKIAAFNAEREAATQPVPWTEAAEGRVVAPPTKQYVAVKLNPEATPETRAALEEAGWVYRPKHDAFFRNVGEANRASVSAEAERILNPAEAPSELESIVGPKRTAPTAFSAQDVENILSGKTEAPKVEIAEPTMTPNASGKTAASGEAISRLAGMEERGDSFMIVDAGANARPLVGVDAVDVRPGQRETKILQRADGTYDVLEDRGGNLRRYNPAPNTRPNLTPDLSEIIDQTPAGAQRRLPGDVGAVRETEAPQPNVGEVPFSLTRQAAKRKYVEPSVFSGTAEKPSSLEEIVAPAEKAAAPPQEPLRPDVAEYRDAVTAAFKGEPIPEMPHYVEHQVKVLDRAIARRKALAAHARAMRGTREGYTPEQITEAVELGKQADDFAARLKTIERRTPSVQERDAASRAKLLDDASPAALDEYARRQAVVQDTEYAIEARNAKSTARTAKQQNLSRNEQGEVIGFGPTAGFVKLAKMYREDPARFWKLMRIGSIPVGGMVGAEADKDDPLRGFVLGALGTAAVTSPAIWKSTERAQVAKKIKAITRFKTAQQKGYIPTRPLTDETKDIPWWHLVKPTFAEREIPTAYKAAMKVMDSLNRKLHYGSLSKASPELQRAAGAVALRTAVKEMRAIAEEFEERRQPRRAQYIREGANALAKQPTHMQQAVKETLKGVGIDAPNDVLERYIGTNIYRVLTGYAVDTALQNLTQPILALRHVTIPDLLWGMKAARTPWGKSITKHVEIHRPVDVETAFGSLSDEARSKLGGIKGFIKDSQRLLAKTDQWNRRATYLAALRQAEKRGLMGRYAHQWADAVENRMHEVARPGEGYGYSGTEADQWAREVMRGTQGDVGPLAFDPRLRGPVGGSLRPFMKFPTLLMHNLVDTVSQPDSGRFVATVAVTVALGKALGLDLEDTLLLGAGPFGLDLTDPGSVVGKIASGDVFPVVRAAKDVYKHLSGTAGHRFAVPSSLDDILNTDVATLVGGRYPVKFAQTIERTLRSDVAPMLKGEARTPHVRRTGTGTPVELTALEDVENLLGLKSTRQAERADVEQQIGRDVTRANQALATTRADLKHQLALAYDAGDQERVQEILAELSQATGSMKSATSAMRGVTMNRYQKILQSASPAMRALLQQKYGQRMQDTEVPR